MPAGRILLTTSAPDACEVLVLGAEDRRLAGMLTIVRAAILGEIRDQRERGALSCDGPDPGPGRASKATACIRCGWSVGLHSSPVLEPLRGPAYTLPAGPMAGGDVATELGVRVTRFDVAAVVDALERNLQAIAWVRTPTVGGRFALVGFWPTP